MNRIFLTTILIAIYAHMPAFSGWFGTDNYWECLLKKMPGVQSDTIAEEVVLSCKQEHPFHKRIYIEKKNPWFGPKTASSCVLKYGKEVRSESGARYIQSACYKLYPDDDS